VTCGKETLDCTTLGALAVGSRVHLERALRLQDRLDGHLVSGHVDGVATVDEARREQESVILWLRTPPELARYVAAKGSIAVDGVSLTVNDVQGDRFRVNVIPYTDAHTVLGQLRPGAMANIEVDRMARHLERLLEGRWPAR
jgi:riboflavin synthase